jgi:hypothetical protein
MEKDPAIYVRHMPEAIGNIETDIAGYDFEKFRADRRTRQHVERNLPGAKLSNRACFLSAVREVLPDGRKSRQNQGRCA